MASLKTFPALVILCVAMHATAQMPNSRLQKLLLVSNNIKLEKIFLYEVKEGATDTTHYLSSTTDYNNRARPVMQVLYLNDGNIKEKTTTTYKDTIATKAVTYSAQGAVIREVVYVLDEKNKGILSRESGTDGRVRETYMLFDGRGAIKKFYNIKRGIKQLSSAYEHDGLGNTLRSDYYDSTGDINLSYVNEYDGQHRQTKTFKIKGDDRKLKAEFEYNSNNQCITETTYQLSDKQIWYANGIHKQFKKGDKSEVKYTYDSRGLLLTEIEFLNGRYVSTIVHEYL